MNLGYNNSSLKARIILLGYIVRCPVGGMTWHYLQYVMGLQQLGYDVYFIEDSDDYPCCYNPTTQGTGFSQWMETGEGILVFNDFDEAVAAIGDVDNRYGHHCKRARDTAEEYFDSKNVLTRLLEEVD